MHSPIKSENAKLIVLISLIIFGSCLGNLSQTALNAMFSGIAESFSVEVEMGQWVTTIYMLVLGITVPAVTYLMRRFSLKRLVIIAFSLLCAGAALDAVAFDFFSLVLGRVLQAIAAGITLPMMMSTIMTSFPREKQGTVMGISGIALGFAPNIGPTIGGWMIGFSGWRSFFVVLAALALLLIVLAAVFMDSGRRPTGEAHLDVASLCLSAVGFGGLLLGCSNASSVQLGNPLVWAPVLVGAVALVMFVLRQKRISHPLINMAIFESKRFVVSFWAGNFLFASFLGITLIVPLYIEGLCGGSALQAGLALLPGTVAALFVNPLSGYLTDKIGVRPVVLVSSVFLVTGSVSMAFLDASSPFWLVVLLQGIRATGVSGLISPLTSWGMADLPHAIMTDGSSFSTAARQACASMGTALMVFAITSGPALGSAALGYHLAFGLSGAFAVAMFACVVLKVR